MLENNLDLPELGTPLMGLRTGFFQLAENLHAWLYKSHHLSCLEELPNFMPNAITLNKMITLIKNQINLSLSLIYTKFWSDAARNHCWFFL